MATKNREPFVTYLLTYLLAAQQGAKSSGHLARFRGKMADDIDEPLAEGWEAVVDDTGRTYWWNTETNETTWTKPVAVLAKKGLAAGAAPA